MSTADSFEGEEPPAAPGNERPRLQPFDLAELLSRADPFLRAMIDTLAEGVLVRGADQRLLAWNPAAERMLGVTVEEMFHLGEGVWTLLQPDGVTPLPYSELPIAVVLRTGAPVRGQVVGFVRRDQSVVWLQINSVPLRAAGEEKPFAVVCTLSDITEQCKVVVLQQQSERRLRVALAAARMNIWEWKVGLNEASWTVSAVPGRAEGDRSGTILDILQLVHPEDRERIRDEFRAIIAGTRGSDPFELEMRMLRHQNEVFWGRATGRAQRDANGNLVGMTGTLADVTQSRQLEKELNLMRRMESIGRLAGGMAHDFSNLLAVMLTAIDSAKALSEKGTAVYEELLAARESADRAHQLTRQLLAFARRQPVLLKELDVNQLVDGLSRLLKQVLGFCELKLELDPGIRRVTADPTQLERVILNLAGNARDAMPKGGVFALSTCNLAVPEKSARALPAGNYVAIVARDQGTGITAEAREHLFEPFFTTKPEGTGLGLASSYGLVRQLGGDIEVESAPGNGATFRVFLPATGAAP